MAERWDNVELPEAALKRLPYRTRRSLAQYETQLNTRLEQNLVNLNEAFMNNLRFRRMPALLLQNTTHGFVKVVKTFRRRRCREVFSLDNYAGCQFQTATGAMCQTWENLVPHLHPFSVLSQALLQGAAGSLRDTRNYDLANLYVQKTLFERSQNTVTTTTTYAIYEADFGKSTYRQGASELGLLTPALAPGMISAVQLPFGALPLQRNSCRNPDHRNRGVAVRGGSSDIWCLTSDPLMRWDFCAPLAITVIPRVCRLDWNVTAEANLFGVSEMRPVSPAPLYVETGVLPSNLLPKDIAWQTGSGRPDNFDRVQTISIDEVQKRAFAAWRTEDFWDRNPIKLVLWSLNAGQRAVVEQYYERYRPGREGTPADAAACCAVPTTMPPPNATCASSGGWFCHSSTHNSSIPHSSRRVYNAANANRFCQGNPCTPEADEGLCCTAAVTCGASVETNSRAAFCDAVPNWSSGAFDPAAFCSQNPCEKAVDAMVCCATPGTCATVAFREDFCPAAGLVYNATSKDVPCAAGSVCSLAQDSARCCAKALDLLRQGGTD